MKQYSNRMITGYILGGLIVFVIVPSIICSLTALLDNLYRIDIFRNDFLKWAFFLFFTVTGMLFGITSIVYQNVMGKGGPLEVANIEISPKTQNLVTTGPYRYSRNPMLFGALMLYLALAVLLNSVSAIIIVIVFALFMLTVVVRKEEERLRKDFGDQYVRYRERTSLIIPWPPAKDKY